MDKVRQTLSTCTTNVVNMEKATNVIDREKATNVVDMEKVRQTLFDMYSNVGEVRHARAGSVCEGR